MSESLIEIIRLQFGGAIDMLENAVTACPESTWDLQSKFWYNAYHCIFYLDYYLSRDPDNFSPPLPFTLSEFDPKGILPERTYSKKELLEYIGYCRNKFYDVISTMDEPTLQKRWVNSYRDYSMLEMLIYNMRHVQHHAAQLNLLLRQSGGNVPRWVSRTNQEAK